MKTAILAAMALAGASFAVTPASAAPLSQGITKYVPQTQVVEVGKRRGGKHFYKRRRGGDDFSFHFGFGVPLALGLGYGLASPYYYDNDRPRCYGKWHRHYSGRLHCHGELVY